MTPSFSSRVHRSNTDAGKYEIGNDLPGGLKFKKILLYFIEKSKIFFLLPVEGIKLSAD